MTITVNARMVTATVQFFFICLIFDLLLVRILESNYSPRRQASDSGDCFPQVLVKVGASLSMEKPVAAVHASSLDDAAINQPGLSCDVNGRSPRGLF
jgi:hypothetical protein